MINIKSIRYGHANNSSSSHSIVFLGDKEVADNYDTGDFGWDGFTLSSRKAKEEYMFIQLMYSLPNVTKYSYGVITEKILVDTGGEDMEDPKNSRSYIAEKRHQARALLNEFAGTFKEIDLEEYAQKFVEKGIEGHIDHQSVTGFAVDIKGGLHYPFVRKLLQTIFENNFVILGGNDNGGDDHKYSPYHIENSFSKNIMTVLEFIRRDSSNSVICIEDEENSDFVLRNKKNGDKLRFSFDKNSKETKKSSFPELVDLKITGHCTYGCSFCYQSSTDNGKHAITEDVERIIDILATSKTFEIAIGGGEPTTHPDFVRILEHASSKGMSVGFTTRNFKIQELSGFKKIVNATDSIAFSCHTVKEIELVRKISEYISTIIKHYNDRPAVYVQIIPELYTSEKLIEMLEASKAGWVAVTLLGYKDFGFGKTYAPKNLNMSSDWIDMAKQLSDKSHLKIGIDSVLVKKWKKELVQKGCNALMLVGEEGKFSCYVDAVEKRLAKSSFTDESEPLDMKKANIIEEFKKF